MQHELTRKRFVQLGIGLPLAAALVRFAPVSDAGAATAAPVAAAAASAASCKSLPLTPGATEGPYFKAGAPRRSVLTEAGLAGTPLTLTGAVLTAGCVPIARAHIDFWQADASGNYDNAGFRLRGYQLTDAKGRYSLKTIVPGLYPGRTEHIHVKITPPGRQALTTQLYFPGVTQNSADGIYNPATLLAWKKAGTGFAAQFTFVV